MEVFPEFYFKYYWANLFKFYRIIVYLFSLIDFDVCMRPEWILSAKLKVLILINEQQVKDPKNIQFTDGLHHSLGYWLHYTFLYEVLQGMLLKIGLSIDVTTLYFEAFQEDELRNSGFSKDNKSQQPQVLVALMLTKEGFPISYEIFSGRGILFFLR